MSSHVITVISLFYHVRLTAAVSTAEGTEFLISTVSTHNEFDSRTMYPRLVLSLISPYENTVTITTRGLENTTLHVSETVSLAPFEVEKFSAEKVFFGPKLASGYRWTYQLSGPKRFVVMVQIESDLTIVETFTAIPVMGWGRSYIVTTLETDFSVVLIANDVTLTVLVTFLFTQGNLELVVDDRAYRANMTLTVNLPEFQSYAISNCGKHHKPSGMTGSFITADSVFGVVAGNCEGITKVCVTDNSTGTAFGLTGSTVAEMLFPLKTAGKIFILFKAAGRDSPGYYIVTSAQDGYTEIEITRNHSDPYEGNMYQLKFLGDHLILVAAFKFMSTSKPVQVVYVQSSRCFDEGGGSDDGDPSMLVFIPVNLFYFIYYCSIPDVTMRHFLAILARERFIETLKYRGNTDPFASPFRTSVAMYWSQSLENWVVREYRESRNTSFTIYAVDSPFGCYLHGVASRATYMHAAGFISSNIHVKYCNKTQHKMRLGDMLDNDCDGLVDEERNDNTDNDGDHEVDEDLGYFFEPNDPLVNVATVETGFDDEYREAPKPTTITPATFTSLSSTSAVFDYGDIRRTEDYGDWTEWQCTRSCLVRDMVRTRECTKTTPSAACSGHKREMKRGQCYVSKCPLDCPWRYFGEDCRYKCTMCIGKCDKFNGSCPKCEDGFDYPESGCQLDRRQYKEWNDWHCSEDCLSPLLVRERLCRQGETDDNNENCTEPKVDKKPGSCYLGKMCPSECEDYRWGADCIRSCENCESPCNRFTGLCSQCKPGFQGTKYGCMIPCGPWQYGPGCHGNCSRKCNGEDCLERINGSCATIPSTNYAVIILLILFFPSVIFSYFVVKRKKTEEKEYAKALETIRSKSKLSLLSRTSKCSVKSQKSNKSSMASLRNFKDVFFPLTESSVDPVKTSP